MQACWRHEPRAIFHLQISAPAGLIAPPLRFVFAAVLIAHLVGPVLWQVDYRGSEVTVESFLRVLSGFHFPGTPPSKKLASDANSRILIYLTGHGGDKFLKFQVPPASRCCSCCCFSWPPCRCQSTRGREPKGSCGAELLPIHQSMDRVYQKRMMPAYTSFRHILTLLASPCPGCVSLHRLCPNACVLYVPSRLVAGPGQRGTAGQRSGGCPAPDVPSEEVGCHQPLGTSLGDERLAMWITTSISSALSLPHPSISATVHPVGWAWQVLRLLSATYMSCIPSSCCQVLVRSAYDRHLPGGHHALSGTLATLCHRLLQQQNCSSCHYTASRPAVEAPCFSQPVPVDIPVLSPISAPSAASLPRDCGHREQCQGREFLLLPP